MGLKILSMKNILHSTLRAAAKFHGNFFIIFFKNEFKLIWEAVFLPLLSSRFMMTLGGSRMQGGKNIFNLTLHTYKLQSRLLGTSVFICVQICHLQLHHFWHDLYMRTKTEVFTWPFHSLTLIASPSCCSFSLSISCNLMQWKEMLSNQN